MSTIRIEAEGLEELIAASANAEGIVRRELLHATERVTFQGQSFAMQAAPVRTGNLRRSITSGVSFAGGAIEGQYGTVTPYARYVEEGRGPVVARGKALRFTVGGRTLYRKRVGPAAARPFIRPSVERLRPLVEPEYRAALQRIVAALGGA